MASHNRTAILAKTYKVLKKHYKPFEAQNDRTLLEHLLVGCCLENSTPQAAESSFRTLKDQFFDWNEVRVSSVRELTEILKPLSDSMDVARRIKSLLQSVFESQYSFDLEMLKRINIGQAVKKLEKLQGATPFVVAYATQHGLGGHSIPVNGGALGALRAIGAISDAEAAEHRVPGLERAVAKSKGIEAASLLHQWGVAFRNHAYSPELRKVCLEIAPDCKDRLPKRPAKHGETLSDGGTAPPQAEEPAKPAKTEAPRAKPPKERTKTPTAKADRITAQEPESKARRSPARTAAPTDRTSADAPPARKKEEPPAPADKKPAKKKAPDGSKAPPPHHPPAAGAVSGPQKKQPAKGTPVPKKPPAAKTSTPTEKPSTKRTPIRKPR